MRILIDFDRTIFDTDKTIAAVDELAQTYGISRQEWRGIWRETYGKLIKKKTALYNIWDHVKKFRRRKDFDSEQFLFDWAKLYELPEKNLFPESLDFLKFCKKLGKLILITYGHKKFQSWKIAKGEIKNHFHHIEIVPTIKAGRFAKLLAWDDLNIFLDDNAHEIDEVKKFHPEVLAVHVRRPGGWYAGQKSYFADFEVKNLLEAKSIIQAIQARFTRDEKRAAAALKQGRAIVYPTDTTYGLGVVATNPQAVSRLLVIKERKNQPVHVVVSDLKMAKQIAVFNPVAVKLFRKFLPGPLTLVLESRISNTEYGRLLGAGTGTIGIRMPDNKTALNLVKKINKPITTTSANPSGFKSSGTAPYSAIDSFQQFYRKKYQPDLYLDAGVLPKQLPSTMIKIDGDKIKVLRKGPINKTQILDAI